METETAREYRTVALVCLAELLSMAGFSAYAAFLPTLRLEWGMTGAQAGFVGGSFFFGYMLVVPVLSSLTDRIDARTVYAGACCLGAAGMTGFALLAGGVLSGAFFLALAGAGLAGTYMPGLRALTDRIGGSRQSRFISFYTASFGLGTAISLLNSGWLGRVFSWRVTILILALGPLLAASTIWLGLKRKKPPEKQTAALFSNFGKVLAHRDTRRYILGYACHSTEVFGVRSWLVAFFAFAFSLHAVSSVPVTPTEAAAIINLFGLPASILGNEAASRFGRKRWIVSVMALSGLLGWFVGAVAAWAWWLTIAVAAVYFIAAMLDSSSLTAGLVQSTPPEYLGSAMAIYSFLGFGVGFLAPIIFGTILDLSGGTGNLRAWTMAFGFLGVGGLVWAATNAKGSAE